MHYLMQYRNMGWLASKRGSDFMDDASHPCDDAGHPMLRYKSYFFSRYQPASSGKVPL